MFPTYNPNAASSVAGAQPDAAKSASGVQPTDGLPPDDIRSRLRFRTPRLQRTLGQVGGELTSTDDYLCQPGKHDHPSAQMDAAMADIGLLEMEIALDAGRLQGCQGASGFEELQEARSVLAQARYYDSTIATVQALENDPNLIMHETPAPGAMVHESGILNLTGKDPLPIPANLLEGEKIIEGLEHALGHAHAKLVHKPNAAAAALRDVIDKPDDEEDEETHDLEEALPAHETTVEAIKPMIAST